MWSQRLEAGNISITASCYSNGYHSENYGTHAMQINVTPALQVYFSYDTPIAFAYKPPSERWQYYRVVNSWGPTTGKHFNQIYSIEYFKTIDSERFEQKLSNAMEETLGRQALKSMPDKLIIDEFEQRMDTIFKRAA